MSKKMKYRDFQDKVKGDVPVLVDFHADWCGPCKVMNPILREVQEHYGDKLIVLKVDVDKNQKIAGKLNVVSIPTLMFYEKGEVKWRAAGARSGRDIKKVVDKALGLNEQKGEGKRFGFFKSLFGNKK